MIDCLINIPSPRRSAAAGSCLDGRQFVCLGHLHLKQLEIFISEHYRALKSELTSLEVMSLSTI